MLLLLSDGKWHLFGELLHTLGKEVGPEKATQIHFTAHHKHLDDREAAAKKSMDERIQLGRSRIVSKIIQDLRRGEIVETRGLHGKKKNILVVGSEVKLRYSTPKELLSHLIVFNSMTRAIKCPINRRVVTILVEIVKQRIRTPARQNSMEPEVEVIDILAEIIKQRLRMVSVKQNKDNMREPQPKELEKEPETKKMKEPEVKEKAKTREVKEPEVKVKEKVKEEPEEPEVKEKEPDLDEAIAQLKRTKKW